jgi:hypothetical protein
MLRIKRSIEMNEDKEKKSEYVYKVVSHYSPERGGTSSCGARHSKLGLRYKIGEETRAAKYTLGVFVFIEKENATWFARGDVPEYTLLRCKYTGEPKRRHIGLRDVYALLDIDGLVEEFTLNHADVEIDGLLFPEERMGLPNGTYTVESVTPIEVV